MSYPSVDGNIDAALNFDYAVLHTTKKTIETDDAEEDRRIALAERRLARAHARGDMAAELEDFL